MDLLKLIFETLPTLISLDDNERACDINLAINASLERCRRVLI